MTKYNTQNLGEPWQKGQSGNPNGRPPDTPEVKAQKAVAKILQDRVDEIAPDVLEKAILLLSDSEVPPAVRAKLMEGILDRAMGKAPAVVDHKSSDGTMTPTRVELVAPNDNGTD